jgi:DivIVA domain-containing protein
MELERRTIERRDFPSARRGYESAEVDRHLRAIADAVEQLKAAPAAQGTVAGATAQRVEAIVAAAEASAREIEERANADAGLIRERAETDAAAHVKRAQGLADELAGRASELQEQIGRLIGQIAALSPELEALDVAEPETEPEPEPEQPSVPEPVIEQVAPVEVVHSAPVVVDGPRAPEGARLIALNMALSGTPREETARYLRENYELEDEDALLDDVYAKAGS